jgi:hypothetical protein
MFKEGQIVLVQGHGTTTFKITQLFRNGFATIEAFSISKQVLMGPPVVNIPTSTLTPFKEDSTQAASRIVREATEDK